MFCLKLLLKKTGDATPLVHAMRIGESHRDVAIVLLGTFSRWINRLEDDDMQNPQTRVLLRALSMASYRCASVLAFRLVLIAGTNLKLAIDYGLQQSQSDLLASFLQTLIMSEGDKFVIGSCE